MSCNYFIISIIAFTVKPDISIESCLLFHNPSLSKQFFMIISISNVIFNTGFTSLFIKLYSKNEELDKEKRYSIFGTYIYFMCYMQILGMIYTINSINFYRVNHRKNVDTFDDKNKLISFSIFIANIFCFYFFVKIMYHIYDKKAKNEYNKKNNILISTNKKED